MHGPRQRTRHTGSAETLVTVRVSCRGATGATGYGVLRSPLGLTPLDLTPCLQPLYRNRLFRLFLHYTTFSGILLLCRYMSPCPHSARGAGHTSSCSDTSKSASFAIALKRSTFLFRVKKLALYWSWCAVIHKGSADTIDNTLYKGGRQLHACCPRDVLRHIPWLCF